MPYDPVNAWGRYLFVGLWVLGLAALAAMATGLLPSHPLAIGAIVLGLCGTIAVGVMSQVCGFFANPLNRVPGATCQLAITFDDGPDSTFTPKVLDLLARYEQRATFFVIGHKVAQNPDLARRIVKEGHELANHTMGHPWHMALWPASRVAEDLTRTNHLIQQVTGAAPIHFRPPAAILSPRIARGAREAGLTLVGFSVRAGDGSRFVSAKHALKRLQNGLHAGAILVLHDAAPPGHSPAACDVLPVLFEELKRRGLRSVPLRELRSPTS